MIFYAIVILVILFLGRKHFKTYVVANYGEEYLPKNKMFLWLGFSVGILGGILGSVFDLQGKDRATDSDELIAVCFGAIIWAIILLTIVNAFRRNKGKGFWARYCCNCFFFLVTFFPGILIGSLLIWGGVFILLAMVAYHGMGLHRLGGGGIKGSLNLPHHNCCNSCSRFDGYHCSENPMATIHNPDSNCCGNFSRKG